MNQEKAASIFFKVAYILLCILVLYSIYTGSLMYEFVFKVLSLLILSFLYLTNSRKINIWYLLVLIFSIISDSFLVFDTDFRLEGTVCLLLNRVFYIIILRDVVFQYPIKRTLCYSIPFLATFGLVFYMIHDFLGDLFYAGLLLGVLSVIMGTLAFLNYLDANRRQNLYFFLGIFIIIISDILMSISTFLGENINYIIFYHSSYFVARYLVYKAMLISKAKSIY